VLMESEGCQARDVLCRLEILSLALCLVIKHFGQLKATRLATLDQELDRAHDTSTGFLVCCRMRVTHNTQRSQSSSGEGLFKSIMVYKYGVPDCGWEIDLAC
jgi:hypothetical protein